MDCICDGFNCVIGNYEVEPLLAISIFIHDFLCIHPFYDGNGHMRRLLTTLLLYRNGFYVGKYISLEEKISLTKESYYQALQSSQDGWHEGTEDILPFIKYYLSIVIAAYRNFKDRFSIVEEKRSDLEMVHKSNNYKIGKFTKQDISEYCPSLSVSAIEGALRKLVVSSDIKREGTGRFPFYYRLK